MAKFCHIWSHCARGTVGSNVVVSALGIDHFFQDDKLKSTRHPHIRHIHASRAQDDDDGDVLEVNPAQLKRSPSHHSFASTQDSTGSFSGRDKGDKGGSDTGSKTTPTVNVTKLFGGNSRFTQKLQKVCF